LRFLERIGRWFDFLELVDSKKIRPLRGRNRAAWLAKSSGEEGKLMP
jgi:hypothetical protein